MAIRGRTQFLPFIAHTGIGDLQGRVHYIAEGDYERYIFDKDQFGDVHKYVTLNLKGVTEEQYTKAIADADAQYRGRPGEAEWYDSACHVAVVLNNLKYNGHSNHSMWTVWWIGCTSSRYTNWRLLAYTYHMWALGLCHRYYR